MGDLNNLPSKKVLKDAFYGFSGGSETLTLDQFKSLCHKFYLSPTNKGIAQLFSKLDKNSDDRLSCDEVEALIEKQWTPISERKQAFLEDLRKVRHSSGPLTKAELRTILQNGSDEALTDEDIDYCFNKMDINKDNQISEEELSELIFKMEDVLSRAPSRVGSHKREDGHNSQSRSRSSSKDSIKDKHNNETRSRSSSKDSDSNSGEKHNKESEGNDHSQSSSRSGSKSSNHEQSGNINDEIAKTASPTHVDDSLKKAKDEEKTNASSTELRDDNGVSDEKHKSRSRSNSPPKDSANDETHTNRSRSRSHSTDSKKSDAVEKPRKGSGKSDHSSAGSHHEHSAHDITSNVGEKPRKGSGKSDHSSAGSHHEHSAHDIANNLEEKPRKGSGKSDHSSAGSHHEHNAHSTNNINADERSEIIEQPSKENVDAAH